MWFNAFRPLLHALPPEAAHDCAIYALSRGWVPSQPDVAGKALRVSFAGLTLPSPVGLAAGFDKNARTLAHIFRQGFGFVECGTITPRPQPGNARPRLFRDASSGSVINRFGFNNDGLEAAQRRFAQPRSGIAGANIGKNKDSEDALADYAACLKGLYPLADYITINVSSPNTQGLRALQEGDALRHLLSELLNIREGLTGRKPMFLKIAPDMEDVQLETIVALSLELGVDGLIISNTTTARPEGIDVGFAEQAGGLSGAPLFASSTAMLRKAHNFSGGALPLIGVGGIGSPQQAMEKLQAGACAVQLYSALVFQGFDLVTQIKRTLLADSE